MAEGAEIAKAYVLVVPSLQGAQKRLTEELVPEAESASHEAGTKGGEKFKAAMGAAAKAAVAVMAAAVGASVGLIKEAVMAYADTEQLRGGIETLFGETADAAIENAQRAYITAGISANEYMEQVTGIAASLRQALGDEDAWKMADYADQAITDMADNASKMGTSMESLQVAYQGFAKANYSMLDNLKLGYGGNKTEMERLLRDAEKLAGFTEGAFDIENMADIIDAIHIIQEDMGIAGNQAAEATETISGSLSSLSAGWRNLIAGLGDPNADIDALVSHVMSSLNDVARNITPVIQRIVQSLTTALPSIVEQVAAMVPVVLPDILEAVVTLATSIAEQLPGILETLVTVITDNAELLVGAAIDIALALVQATPRIINVLVDAIPKILGGEDGNGGILGEITKPENQESFVMAAIAIATAVVEGVPDILKALLPMVPTVIENLASAFQDDESQAAFAEAGKALGKALIDGILYIGSITNLPNMLLRRLQGSDNWASFSAAVNGPSYSGQAIDLGGYNGVQAQSNISIGNLSVSAPTNNSASALFDAVRRAAAQG